MSAIRVIPSLAALSGWIDREVACSDWLTVEQARINQFAEVTGDRQWIHIDPERAARESPFGATIVHGYLTLALLPVLFRSCLYIKGVGTTVNCGVDKVRFPAPVLAGQRVRARLTLGRVTSIGNGVQVRWLATVEIDGGTRPACTAQIVVRYYGATRDAAPRHVTEVGKRDCAATSH